MTRRDTIGFLAPIVAMGLLLVGCTAMAGGHPACTDAFAQRVAGSYLMDLTAEGFPPLKVLVTLGADGTFSSEDTSDKGLLSGAGGPASESDNRGAWRRSGRYEVTFTAIGFSYGPDGALVGVGRLSGTLKFSKCFRTFSAKGQHDVFFQGQDPLDPASEPDIPILWTATARRIPARVN
jgi:hypothetical protein